jgi:hypothetical protein
MHTLSFTIPNQSSLPLPTLGEDQAFSKCGDTTYVFHPQGQNLGKVMLAETGVFQDSFVISNKFQQIYTFIAFSESGCPTDTLIYEHHNSPSPQEDYQNIVCIGDANGHVIYPENYGSQQFSYTWSNGVMSNVNDNLSPDQYYVTITDQWGCTTMDDFIIDEESRRFELEIYSIKDQFCENDIAGGNVFFCRFSKLY